MTTTHEKLLQAGIDSGRVEIVNACESVHKSITLERVTRLAESQMFGTANPGICVACGAGRDGCEPDARNYECYECRAMMVFGAEELLFTI